MNDKELEGALFEIYEGSADNIEPTHKAEKLDWGTLRADWDRKVGLK